MFQLKKNRKNVSQKEETEFCFKNIFFETCIFEIETEKYFCFLLIKEHIFEKNLKII